MALRGRNVLQDSRRMGVWCVGRARNDSASRQLEMKVELQPSRSTFDLALRHRARLQRVNCVGR